MFLEYQVLSSQSPHADFRTGNDRYNLPSTQQGNSYNFQVLKPLDNKTSIWVTVKRSTPVYTHGCHPGKSLHRFFGSMASRMRWFTCPDTLKCTPSSTPSSFCLSLNSILFAILFTLSSTARFSVLIVESRQSPTALAEGRSSSSAFCCRAFLFSGLSVHDDKGS